ncbi:MAG: zf-HC2 domain-containing protein [bacterium]|nr:zf-HC2 domain-containing protein [bacterium]
MDCKEFERLITDFIDRRMDYPTLKRFCGHMEQCADCREELVIQFLVTEGVQRLEEGGTFELQKELDQRIDEAVHKLKVCDRFVWLGTALEVLAVCMLAGIVFWILL